MSASTSSGVRRTLDDCVGSRATRRQHLLHLYESERKCSPPTRREEVARPSLLRDSAHAYAAVGGNTIHGTTTSSSGIRASKGIQVMCAEVIRGIREEARAFDVFLSHEVVPTAQKLFDSAGLHHAKACRLLHKDSLPQLVALESDAAQQSARRRGRSLHKKITAAAAAAVVVPAAAPAVPDDDLPPPPVRSASQPRPSRGYLSDSTGASLNVSGNSSTSTNIWLQAVRAGVIEVGPPPTVGSRATLPARRSNAAAAAAATAATAAGPIGTIKAQRGPGASAGGAEGRVGKGNGRAKVEEGLEGGAEQGQAREPRNEEVAMGCGGGTGHSGGGGNDNVSSVAAGRWDGSGGDAARQWELPRQEAVGDQDERDEDDKDEGDEDDLDDDEEEDEGWDVSLSKMVAAEINSKIVGLSSIIRQKAAESAKARRKPVR